MTGLDWEFRELSTDGMVWKIERTRSSNGWAAV